MRQIAVDDSSIRISYQHRLACRYREHGAREANVVGRGHVSENQAERRRLPNSSSKIASGTLHFAAAPRVLAAQILADHGESIERGVESVGLHRNAHHDLLDGSGILSADGHATKARGGK